MAIRITKHPFCSQLIRELGRPIISTSANVQGEPFPQSYEEISQEIKNGVDLVVDQSYDKGPNPEPSLMLSFNSKGELKFIRS